MLAGYLNKYFLVGLIFYLYNIAFDSKNKHIYYKYMYVYHIERGRRDYLIHLCWHFAKCIHFPYICRYMSYIMRQQPREASAFEYLYICKEEIYIYFTSCSITCRRDHKFHINTLAHFSISIRLAYKERAAAAARRRILLL